MLVSKSVKIAIGDISRWHAWCKPLSHYVEEQLPAFLAIVEQGHDDVLWWPLELEPHGHLIESPAITVGPGRTFARLSMSFARYSAELDLLLLSHITDGGSVLEEALWPKDDRDGSDDLLIALPLYRVPVEGAIEGLVISTSEEDATNFPVATNLSEKTWQHIVALFLR